MKQITRIDINSPGEYQPFLNGWKRKDFQGIPLILGYRISDMAGGVLIADCMENVILKRTDIEGVIYAGVAIAKAREHFGDAITSEKTLYTSNDNGAGKPDGYHLSQRACYLVGLVWFGTLTGEDISNASDVWNNFKGNKDDYDAAIEAAKVAIAEAN